MANSRSRLADTCINGCDPYGPGPGDNQPINGIDTGSGMAGTGRIRDLSVWEVLAALNDPRRQLYLNIETGEVEII